MLSGRGGGAVKESVETEVDSSRGCTGLLWKGAVAAIRAKTELRFRQSSESPSTCEIISKRLKSWREGEPVLVKVLRHFLL